MEVHQVEEEQVVEEQVVQDLEHVEPVIDLTVDQAKSPLAAKTMG